jgi:4-hydroxy-tetrahydrodipicolinate reductase
MKICLIGYGKMGKAIEEILLGRGHEISGKIQHNNEFHLAEILPLSDVAIEFTRPEAAVSHIKICADHKIPVVCGTTGWLEEWKMVTDYITENKSALIFASNFSVGVQIFFELNKKLAVLMNGLTDYQCSLEEIHHTQKKDAPSGTALTLAEDILTISSKYDQWKLKDKFMRTDNELEINSIRTDPAVGTHKISYTSVIDDISIIHTAYNRQGFALGAVLAAEWIKGKQGIYTMRDVLNL